MARKPVAATKPKGSTGLNAWSGSIREEFLPQLVGVSGRRVYREMSDNDATIGALLTILDFLIRGCDWRLEPSNKDSAAAAEAVEFVNTVTTDMDHTFEDFISEALSMLVYGWSAFEMVFKRRGGLDTDDKTQRSKYNDGMIGVRKIEIRSQETLSKWVFDDEYEVVAMEQQPISAAIVTIPQDRLLLFRTVSRKNNPEGRSILRNAYRSWWLMKTAEDIEGVGIERELAGLPVVRCPAEVLNATEGPDVALRNTLTKIARDLKFNEQGGLLLPSDVWTDASGMPISNAYKITVDLISTGGTRAINTDGVITRYQKNIARTVLADFLMLGTDSGNRALSEDKSSLFLRSVRALLWQLAAPLNRVFIPQLMQLNGISPELWPSFNPGNIAPPDLDKIGNYVQKITSSGAVVFPSENLTNHLLGLAGLPEVDAIEQGDTSSETEDNVDEEEETEEVVSDGSGSDESEDGQ